jgi:tetratricopeptide (TPR) repeat protein
VRDRWEVFSGPQVENAETGPRIGQAVPDKRADYWGVALDAFGEHPVAGVGAGGFERVYTQNKAHAKHSRYAHNIWLAELTEAGLIGLGLLLAALAGLWVGLARRRAADAELVAATVVLSAGFFLQCSVDWLDEVPGLLATALWAPLAALAATAPPRAGRGRTPVAMIALGLVTVASLALPYAAVRYVERGVDAADRSPAAALADYDRAASADPLTIQPLLRRGFLELRLRRPAEARAAFEEVLEREDHWVAHFELGLLDAQAGRFAPALAELRRAAQLNRGDTLLLDAIDEVREGERVDPLEVNARVLAEPVLAAP